MLKKRVLRTAAYTTAAGAMAAGAVVGTMGAASAVPSAGAVNGCPNGAVCVYTESGWFDGTPEHVYEAYGAHELHNEFGNHYVYNNQHSGATYRLCNDAEGADCRGGTWEPGAAPVVDLTPLNSIKLVA